MDLNSSEDEEEPQARVPAAYIKAAAGACARVAAEPVNTLRVVKLRVLGLPEGWACSKHGPQYKQYTEPEANPFDTPSFATKPFAAATSAAASTPVAASEASNNCWGEIEVTPDDLIEDHPPPSELVGADVCVMATAYPTHALSRSGAVGWRGQVTHSRRGAVRVFGSWFRLADEAFIRPIKEAAEEPALMQEPVQVPSLASPSQPSVPALEVLAVGQAVESRFRQKRGWFPGVVRRINEDGTLAIDYNDGDQEEKVLRKHARRQEEPELPRPPLPPTLSGRLRTAPWRLDASLLAAPQYGKQASRREELEEPSLKEEKAATTPRLSSSARAVTVAVIDEAEGLQLHQPASASSGGARTSSSHGRFRGRVCHDHQGSDGGARDEGSAAVAVVDEAEGLQLHLSASASSGYKGVNSIASGRWQARIRRGHNHDNPLTLGTFDTAVEAAVAYAHAANEGSASAKVKQATLTTAAAGSVLLSLATSLKRGHEQASKADPPAKRQRTDRTPPAPLLAGDQVRKQLMEAKELKDNELIDEVEYKQMKAAIIAFVVRS